MSISGISGISAAGTGVTAAAAPACVLYERLRGLRNGLSARVGWPGREETMAAAGVLEDQLESWLAERAGVAEICSQYEAGLITRLEVVEGIGEIYGQLARSGHVR